MTARSELATTSMKLRLGVLSCDNMIQLALFKRLFPRYLERAQFNCDSEDFHRFAARVHLRNLYNTRVSLSSVGHSRKREDH